ncbi:terpenoid synthase [Venturia nashicola]|uniref:geranylgeranyl diphosphate synthase n=1 Tax=Venturia nashicola TaxID=86259 RepID=A0A4Z1NSC3_9PEZI|nr:terpenoid synthase [Venturia nashicola]TLD29654.1 terpenoid synthase [Venturia nashicola]
MASTLDPSPQTFQATEISIPPRTSSHQRANSQQTFQDASGNTISPSSPPVRRSSLAGNRFSNSIEPGWKSHGKQTIPISERPHTSYFPASESTTREGSILKSSTALASRTYTKSPPKSKPMGAYSPLVVPEGLVNHKQPPWSKPKEKVLLGPYDYLLEHPGKDIRATMISAFNSWLQVPDESLSIITKVVGMLHTASLLQVASVPSYKCSQLTFVESVDDVEDSSLLRRGVPVAHSIFGVAQTINSANYVYFLALQQLSLLNNPATIQIYTEELLNLHRGQGMDLYWRDTLTCPTEADYLEMVGNKTGGLFRLAIKLMQAESPLVGKRGAGATYNSSGDIDCVPLVSTVGLLFQIMDDIQNLSSPIYAARKGLCEDLTEGKFSFPVIHAIRADPHNLTLLNILKQKTQDEAVKKYAVAYMEKMGSFEYSTAVVKVLGEEALQMVADLEGRVGGEGGMMGAEGIRGILANLKVPELTVKESRV